MLIHEINIWHTRARSRKPMTLANRYSLRAFIRCTRMQEPMLTGYERRRLDELELLFEKRHKL
jgi:hypothetical protein